MNLTDITDKFVKNLRLSQSIENSEDKVNAFLPYKENGITQIYVTDLGTEFELVNGEWVEVSPF